MVTHLLAKAMTLSPFRSDGVIGPSLARSIRRQRSSCESVEGAFVRPVTSWPPNNLLSSE